MSTPDDKIVIPKEWYLSKTIWFNVLTSAVAIITLLTSSQGLIPASATPWLLFAVGVINIVLRKLTSQPITFSKNP